MSSVKPARPAIEQGTEVTDVAIRLAGVSKTFVPGVPVLRDVTLNLRAGQVTALVGANGSGKSTMVKILSGYHEPDRGSTIEVSGSRIHDRVTPGLMRHRGVRFVHQDVSLASDLTVLDNVALDGFVTGRLGTIRWSHQKHRLNADLARWRIDARPSDVVSSLPRSTVAKLTIMRAVQRREGEHLTALILDEPTASLGHGDADDVLEWIRRLASQEHVGVLFISHRLDEVLKVSHSVAVLRNGRIVAHDAAASLDHESLVRHVVGGAVGRLYPERAPREEQTIALRVSGLSGGALRDASFVLHRGEVLGVTGLPGSGFDDIPYLLMDPTRRAGGSCELSGTPLDLAHESLASRVARGMVLVPGDRKRHSIAGEMSVRENVTLPQLGSLYRRGSMSRRAETRLATSLGSAVGVRPADPELPAGSLSGGNQQKVVLAKWLGGEPEVIVIHEPTEAVDVGAKAEIFQLIASAVARGAAVLIASVEYEDLAHLADRVLVISRGTVSAQLTGGELSATTITAAAFGLAPDGAPNDLPGHGSGDDSAAHSRV